MAAERPGVVGPRWSSSCFHDNEVAVEGWQTLPWELGGRRVLREGVFGQRTPQREPRRDRESPPGGPADPGDLPEASSPVRALAEGPGSVSRQLFLEGGLGKGASSGKQCF